MTIARLERIWIKRAHRAPMDPAVSASLDTGKGIRGNANYAGRRQVTIISAERWQELMAALADPVDPSARRANLMIGGLDLEASRGRLLLIGKCALRIGGETRPCERMDDARAGLQALMRERWGGGAWATVEAGGDIAVGDVVRWAEEAAYSPSSSSSSGSAGRSSSPQGLG